VSAADSKRIEPLLRELAPQVLGALVRRFGDFSRAEDAVQEALVAASLQWEADGLPDNPRGWLIQVAFRRLSDQRRAELARRRREAIVMVRPDEDFAPGVDESGVQGDDALLLLFMCSHPALTRASAIALTLRAVGGLTTAEIARAFMVPEATMAQRISRAKQTIAASRIPFERPTPDEAQRRLSAVLHVLYLIFNEGYAATSGTRLSRKDLAEEAIRLTRGVHELLPEDPEVTGLLALMLLTDARRDARTGPEGELVPLDEQDRSLWDRALVREGVSLVSEALKRGAVGPYQLQAAIAAVHDEAASTETTDWPEIHALYGLLRRMSDNPMVALSETIAAAMVHGPETGLELLKRLDADARLAVGHRLEAVRGHLLERAGRIEEAIVAFRAAALRTTSTPERNYLLLKASRLAG
jgi:predicted RNA polymerase sigma factor